MNTKAWLGITVVSLGIWQAFAEAGTYDGQWSGTTDQGYPVVFVIDDDVVPFFRITMYLDGQLCSSEIEVTVLGGSIPVSGGGFTVENGEYQFAGAFTSGTTCAGTWEYYDDYCVAYDNGTWEADMSDSDDGWSKLTTVEQNAEFGSSVCINGDYAIVGAPWGDGEDLHSGSAYVFTRYGTIWAEQTDLTAPDGAEYDGFGSSVCISGDWAIVGAPGDDNCAGSAYMFDRSGAFWSEQDKLIASDSNDGDSFGCSVCIDGDCAIVGAEWGDGVEPGSGAAYIFERDGTAWTQCPKLAASDGAELRRFGCSVSVCGDYAIVGAYEADGNEPYSGAAYVFERDGTTWTEQAKLTASDGVLGDCFGYSVSVAGDCAVVGAPFADCGADYDAGSAYVFERGGTTWTQQARLTPSDSTMYDRFGSSVCVSGDHVIVGAEGDDGGSACVFTRSGANWIQRGKLTARDGGPSDSFGHSVSINGDYAIVGAPGGDGAAYVVTRSHWYSRVSDDFNGDRKSDLLWRQVSTGYQTVTIMDGATIGSSAWLGGNTDWPIVGRPDLNGDGKSDLLWRQVSTGYHTATLMDGLAMGSSAWLGGNADWQIVATPDFNGDGKADLLWRQASTGYQTATLMDGLTMDSNAWLGGNTDWPVVGTPDFNGDGKSDLLWRQVSTGYQTATLMDGLAMDSSGWLGGSTDWQVVGTPDLNGDGKSDLLWRQVSTGYHTATLMDGLTMGDSGWLGGNTDWQIVGTPDFDGNGKSDLLWRQTSTGYQTATIMGGLILWGSGWLGGDADRQIVGTPDFNGDGKSDLLWRRASTGQHTATPMDGLTTGSSGWLGGSLDWQIVTASD